MSDLPSMPLFVDDYEAATAHLTLEEDGAYMRLLRLCWRSPGCSLPDDLDWICRRLRVHEEQTKKLVANLIAEFFFARSGRIYQKRLKKEFDYVTRISEARRKAGKRGARAKQLKNQETGDSKSDDLPEPTGEANEEQTDGKALALTPTLTPTISDTSVSDADGVDPPEDDPLDIPEILDRRSPDPTKTLFDVGLGYLTTHGLTEAKARPLLGKWRKHYGDAETLRAVQAAIAADASEPVAYIERTLRGPPPDSQESELFKALKERANS